MDYGATARRGEELPLHDEPHGSKSKQFGVVLLAALAMVAGIDLMQQDGMIQRSLRGGSRAFAFDCPVTADLFGDINPLIGSKDFAGKKLTPYMAVITCGTDTYYKQEDVKKKAKAGEECTITTSEGFNVNGQQTMKIQCNGEDGAFKVENDGSVHHESDHILVAENKCNGGTKDGKEFENYKVCTFRHTGDTCAPECERFHADGKTPSGVHICGSESEGCRTHMTLLCDLDGTFSTEGGFCLPDECVAGPQDDGRDALADYTECDKHISGDTCIPKCPPDYYTAGSFKQQCSRVRASQGGGYSAKGATCEPNRCKGPKHPQTGKDGREAAIYKNCEGKVSGQNCTLECAEGYYPIGQNIILGCNLGKQLIKGKAVDGTYETEGFKCVPHKCTSGPYPPPESMDMEKICTDQFACDCQRWSSKEPCRFWEQFWGNCMNGETGDTCIPDCPGTDGYRLVSLDKKPFPLTCYKDQHFHVPKVHSKEPKTQSEKDSNYNIGCVPEKCSIPEGQPDGAGVDHTYAYRCADSLSGEKCTPSCIEGYHPSGQLTLSCPDGQLLATHMPNLCSPNKCTKGPKDASASDIAMWGHCSTKVTADACEPVCPSALAGGRTVPLIMQCDSDGAYPITNREDQEGSAESTFAGCVSKCGGGPTKETRDPNADYSDCLDKESGDTCTPRCQKGYTLDKDLTLECFHNQFSASSARCVAHQCRTGIVDDEHYSSLAQCVGKHTGEKCVLHCEEAAHSKAGPHSMMASRDFILNCDKNGVFDANGTECLPHPVARPGRCETEECSWTKVTVPVPKGFLIHTSNIPFHGPCPPVHMKLTAKENPLTHDQQMSFYFIKMEFDVSFPTCTPKDEAEYDITAVCTPPHDVPPPAADAMLNLKGKWSPVHKKVIITNDVQVPWTCKEVDFQITNEMNYCKIAFTSLAITYRWDDAEAAIGKEQKALYTPTFSIDDEANKACW